MTAEETIEILQEALDIEIRLKEHSTPETLVVPVAHIKSVCRLLHEDERFYFDMLSCVTAVDNGVDAQTIDLVYHLYSVPFDVQLAIQTTVERQEPKVDTVSDIWRTANWHEREAFDLVGVVFEGHPDLRRILLPNDWEGHPLRKDYKEQEKYHGMSVVYDREQLRIDNE